MADGRCRPAERDGHRRTRREGLGRSRAKRDLAHPYDGTARGGGAGSSGPISPRRLDKEIATILLPAVKRSGWPAKKNWPPAVTDSDCGFLSVFSSCGIIAGLVGWINQAAIKEQWNWYAIMRPYMNAHVRPFVLSTAAERALRPKSSFQECEKNCPEMVALPPGSFVMGSPEDEKGHTSDESPLHAVTVSSAFAISRYLVTFAEWDACVAVGGCPPLADSGFGHGNKPVVNVNWNEAQQYVAWLSLMTGKSYRLLTEAEWEYAERAGTRSAYFWGDDIGVGNAVCIGCGSKWDNKQTAPVGSFNPNAFGLYDMLGNAWVWVEDCYHDSYADSPTDGSAWTQDCEQGRRAVRGGGWDSYAINLRSANRDRISIGTRINDLGFRIARTLEPGVILNSAETETPPEGPAAHR